MSTKTILSLKKFEDFAKCGETFLIKIGRVIYEAIPNPTNGCLHVGTYIVFLSGRLKDVAMIKSWHIISPDKKVLTIETIPNRYSQARDRFTIGNVPAHKVSHYLRYYNGCGIITGDEAGGP
jgi:hypothetical protein